MAGKNNTGMIFIIIGIIAVIYFVYQSGFLGGIGLQAVFQPGDVIFRTNEAEGVWGSSTWISYDIDGDGLLEGLGRRASYTGCPPTGWGTNYIKLDYQTPAGAGTQRDIYVNPDSVGICKATSLTVFKEQYGLYANADLTPDPTEPYASLGQEAYESGVPGCIESWTCGTWSTCSGGTQTRVCTDANNCGTTTTKPAEVQSCTSGAFICDSNSDGLISRTELGETITKWIIS